MVMIYRLLQFFVPAVFLIMVTGDSTAAAQATSPTVTPMTRRAPGLHRHALPLSVSRTLGLKHVDPAIYAKALGNDPQRIFEFVRDQIAYESYEGCLRGARGTLLAMAGNSVDRALLLATMLQAGGRRTRYASGTISDADAEELIKSMWVARPDVVGPSSTSSNNKSDFVDFVPGAIERDLKAIRSLVPKKSALEENVISSATLLKETKQHFWLQWEDSGKWIDLDPSLADSLPGKSLTVPDKTLDLLPDDLFHRVTIRIRVEEYEGSKYSSREVLNVSARAA